jgi:predicted nucleotidyltransferase
MTNSELLERLRSEVVSIGQEVPNTTWFLFGSAALGAPAPSDVDVLVLCSGDEEAMAVRYRLADACLRFPLHLLVLTQEEERELDFIETQSCRRIYPTLHDAT